LVNVKTNL